MAITSSTAKAVPLPLRGKAFGSAISIVVLFVLRARFFGLLKISLRMTRGGVEGVGAGEGESAARGKWRG